MPRLRDMDGNHFKNRYKMDMNVTTNFCYKCKPKTNINDICNIKLGKKY